jgi:hypothetical protein
MIDVFEGGCLCGKIRYRIAGTPEQPNVCHCSICRRASGAPFVAWATFRSDEIEWLCGEPRRYASSSKAERTFCGDCGTALSFRLNAEPNYTDVTLGSLDSPERIQPAHHIFTTTRLPWIHLADGLPTFPGERDQGPE